MTTLTYPFLGDAVKAGQPLGCDPTGWPYRVEAVTHVPSDVAALEWRPGDAPDRVMSRTLVVVEPWPLLSPAADRDEKTAYLAAMAHARDRMAGLCR